jgi:hypothetical protein
MTDFDIGRSGRALPCPYKIHGFIQKRPTLILIGNSMQGVDLLQFVTGLLRYLIRNKFL